MPAGLFQIVEYLLYDNARLKGGADGISCLGRSGFYSPALAVLHTAKF